jgi:4,5-DOPA dioxygenase extradiol
MDYRILAPHATRNHPTEDHLLPLFVALGAAGEGATAVRIHASHTYGVLAMDAYSFVESNGNRMSAKSASS